VSRRRAAGPVAHGPLRGVSIGGGMPARTWISRGVKQGRHAIFNARLGSRINQHVAASWQANNLFNHDDAIRPPSAFFSVFGDRRDVMPTVRPDF
jgi:outer membrane receptor for ferric coprogen and ferric-rhodotorulic acid